MKNYLKIGIAVSLAAHIGIFALGGYVMDRLTNSMQQKAQQIQQDDITYADVDVQTQPEETQAAEADESSEQAEPDSEISIAGEQMQQAEATPEPQQTQDDAKAELQVQAKQEMQQAKPVKYLRRYSDIKDILVQKIPPSKIMIPDFNKKNSSDFMPQIKKRVLPEYDHSLIPEGEEVIVTIEYIMDDNGKVIQAYPIRSARASGVVPDDVAEELDVDAIEALKQYEIVPPKDPQARRSAWQVPFIYTPEGARFGAAAELP